MTHRQDTLEAGVLYEVLKSECGSFGAAGRKNKYIRYTQVWNGGDAGSYDILDADKNVVSSCSSCFYVSNGVFTKGYIKRVSNKVSTINMTLIEKAKLAFKGEPEKSFIKAGVMDSNENLTSEGQELFLTFLLKKHGDDFKTTVVDPILKEEETAKANG